MKIVPADFSDPGVLGLLREHLDGMHASSPPGSVYALDLSALQSRDIAVWAVWDGEALAGIGALRELTPTVGEVKSMRTSRSYLRRGVAAALLEHIIGIARSRGYRRLSLETGSGPAFEPALTLYSRFGFVEGGAFADYVGSDFNQFLHLDL